MANPVPLPQAPARDLVIHLAALPDPVGIPTNHEVVSEHNLLLRILRAQHDPNGILNEDQLADAILRHHRIISTRADHDMGNANNVVALAQIQASLVEIIAQLALTNTQRSVDRARKLNHSKVGDLNSQLIAVPKHTAGHPDFQPPNINGVNFEANYAIGGLPPADLVPMTNAAFTQFLALPLHHLRRRLRAIFWFYNDPTLLVAADANRATCVQVSENLRLFISQP